MRFTWLLSALLGGEAALNGPNNDKLSVCESKALIGKAITYQQVNQQQLTDREQPHVGLHGSPLASPGAGAGVGAIHIDIDCKRPTVVQRRVSKVFKSTNELIPPQNQNQTELKFSQGSPARNHDGKLEGSSSSKIDSSQLPESKPPSHDYDPGPKARAEAGVEARPKTKTPASPNRKIIYMGVGLLSVMLIMVFL